MQKALFLDRDGVINVDYGYVHKEKDFTFMPHIVEFLKNIKIPIIVITNQSGIARGYYNKSEFNKITRYMVDELQKEGIEIMDLFYCPHAPGDGCRCRKPNPKMILDAAEKHNIDLANSTFIGDKESDMQAAQNAGIGTKILIGNHSEIADKIIQDIKEIQDV